MLESLLKNVEERTGYFGAYGGAFTPEILRSTLDELIAAFEEARRDPSFWEEFLAVMQSYSCRPTPITPLKNLSDTLGGPRIYMKREDLNQTGSHKINNVMGQGLLVARMGKKRVIAETGAGQHGVATATMAARLGLECTIYMGAVDVERQRPNVFWMEQLGAEVVSVEDGSATLKDAINQCLRDWAFSMDDTHYVLGTACGPHPFPQMVASFQQIIGQECREQMLADTGRLPDRVYCCVGGGSNATGTFLGFLDDAEVELVGIEAGGEGLDSGRHAARLAGSDGSPGVAQGYKTYFLQDEEGQMRHTHSVAAGPRLHRGEPDPGLPAGQRTGALRGGHRRRGAGSVPDAAAPGRHHRRAGKRPRRGRRHPRSAADGPGPDHPGDPVGPRRQGHLHHRRGVERPRLAAIPATESRPLNLRTYIEGRLGSRKILLMTHVIVGYPSLDANWRMLEQMERADVDLVELQMPFSEPIADGPVFARANQEALKQGLSTKQYFDFMARATERFGFPHLMMGYYNTVFRLTHRTFCERLSRSGGAGFIVPDLPIEEYHDLSPLSEAHGLTPIALITPTNTDARLAEIGRHGRGFVYGVARRGVTGKPTDLKAGIDALVARYRAATDLPLALGFGIAGGDDVRQLHGSCEIAIVGSALLERWESGGEGAYADFLQELRKARF